MVLSVELVHDIRIQRAGLTSASIDRYGPTANIDVYNVFNGSAVLGANNTYGLLWQTPAAQLNLEVDSILPGRLVHFGGELSF